MIKLNDTMECEDTRATNIGRGVRAPGADQQQTAVVYPALPSHTFARMSPQVRSQLALQDVGTLASPGFDDELEARFADVMPSVAASSNQYSGLSLTTGALQTHNNNLQSPSEAA